ncbi:MAG: transcription termination/antitermination factor NusG [Oscillospiraceae bacterium]|nr:transcription termination/antitermination factor NusG [Oscillospiraceae bacterium]
MAEEAKWYVVHTYSAYENTVKNTIEKTIVSRGLQDTIYEIEIPMETVTEYTDNGIKTYDRKLFPGYVLIKMVMSDEAWHIIKNVRGVTGFITSGSDRPVPLTEAELINLGLHKREIVLDYKVGSLVRIIDGPFVDVKAKVLSIDLDNEELEVSFELLKGQTSTMKLRLDQVEAI